MIAAVLPTVFKKRVAHVSKPTQSVGSGRPALPAGKMLLGNQPSRTCNLCFHNIFIIRRNVYPDVDDRLSDACASVVMLLVVVQLGIVISVRKVADCETVFAL